MLNQRSSGILLHISSLPGPGGIGDLGEEAHHMVDRLARAGQSYWQVLPIGPTGYGDSPYQLFSSFAGNPLFVSLSALVRDGLLDAADIADAPPSARLADYGVALCYRPPRLLAACRRLHGWHGAPLLTELHAYCHEQREWLDDFALFMALKEEHGMAAWYTWAPPLRDRHEGALHDARQRLRERLDYHRFVQWQFDRQWRALRERAHRAGVRLLGDIPIFVAHDSCDVWASRADFRVRDDGSLVVQAGVPPDYFSEKGQLWGNPLYDWERMAREGYSFWRRRVHHLGRHFDSVRIDHFRGFAGYWEVPGDAPDALSGRWVQGPGAALFHAIGDTVPLVAEDLGLITRDVEELRDGLGLPGMRVLQFSFGDSDELTQRPYAYRKNMVVYTSTHDNNTLMGWYRGEDEQLSPSALLLVDRERQALLDYLGLPRERAEAELPVAAIRLLLSTVSDLVIFPVQDVLGLGGEARMNAPGRPEGNWRFRLTPGQLTDAVLDQLRGLVRIYGRTGV